MCPVQQVRGGSCPLTPPSYVSEGGGCFKATTFLFPDFRFQGRRLVSEPEFCHSNKLQKNQISQGRYTLGDKLQQHVAATRRSDKSLRVYWKMFVKISVSATEFCRSNLLQKIKSDRICATCRGDKILLQRQRFSPNFSSTHEAICRCDVSPQHVAATSRRTCIHGVICRRDLLLQLVA